MAAKARPWRIVSQAPAMQRRAFSRTRAAQRKAGVISFEKTSNEELDKLLDMIRHKIILPTYLSDKQRKQLRRLKYAKKLELEPIMLELDGVTMLYKYRHPRNSGIPPTRPSFNRALAMMHTKEEFANLPALFEGIVLQAGHRIGDHEIQRMVRLAGVRGHISVVAEMARTAKQHGLYLHRPEVISELLAWLIMPAADRGFRGAETRKALGATVGVLDLLEQEIHQPSKAEQARWEDVRLFPAHRDPMYLALRLSLASIVAAKFPASSDPSDQVERHAKQLVALWPAGKGLTALHAREAYLERNMFRYMTHRDTYLFYASPILYGLEMTSRLVKDPQVAEEVRDRFETLQKEARCALTPDVVERDARGMQLYKKIFGPVELGPEPVEDEPVESVTVGTEEAEPEETEPKEAEAKEVKPEEREPEQAEPKEAEAEPEPDPEDTNKPEQAKAKDKEAETKEAEAEKAEPKEAEPAKQTGMGRLFGLFRRR